MISRRASKRPTKNLHVCESHEVKDYLPRSLKALLLTFLSILSHRTHTHTHTLTQSTLHTFAHIQASWPSDLTWQISFLRLDFLAQPLPLAMDEKPTTLETANAVNVQPIESALGVKPKGISRSRVVLLISTPMSQSYNSVLYRLGVDIKRKSRPIEWDGNNTDSLPRIQKNLCFARQGPWYNRKAGLGELRCLSAAEV